MADIRVERKGGTKAWLWVVLALIVLALALFLLYQGGYIRLGLGADATELQYVSPAQLAIAATSPSQEVLYG